ncbi:MAG: F0F1 ATP synthase subunit B [Candidatus Pacebacteria bacterium]|jgi:F-type H+-transporting ATPase subunit b|nr:F0F1 ATP synthase subunit B [Candidatus Paceibacterota bacterium]
MDSIISTFHIDWKIIIAQAFNFGVVFVVLYIFALKPLSKLMNERAEKISKGIDDAKTNSAILTKTQAEYDEVLRKAKNEANTIFQSGKKEAEAKKMEMIEEAKNEVATIISNGKKTLEAEKVKMVAEAKKEVVALAMTVAEKLLGQSVNKEVETKIIKELGNI